MIKAIPAIEPTGAALFSAWGRSIMDVILHVGAHRTATTSFQRYAGEQRSWMGAQGITYWGPAHCRRTLFPGLFRTAAVNRWRQAARRAEGRIGMHCARADAAGTEQLLVSDENMLGSSVQCLRHRRLYPASGERMARLVEAFGGRLTRVVISLRAQDLWWSSAAALTLSRGHPLPSPAACEAISHSRRGWRDVITDMACALPGVDLRVHLFERDAGRPDLILQSALNRPAPRGSAPWLNRSPDLNQLRTCFAEESRDVTPLGAGQGRYIPFDAVQLTRLRELYADDLHWLVAGADGLAHLIEERPEQKTGTGLPPGIGTKGQDYDIREGQMAHHR
ncbi:MAG: hypothetical protein P1U53_14485 [Sulfitobacter sp.]|nr:hypothetical protein [Sulfitobacter sp.]